MFAVQISLNMFQCIEGSQQHLKQCKLQTFRVVQQK